MSEQLSPTGIALQKIHEEIEAPWRAQVEDLLEALTELADLMQGVIDGNYKPDSFTLQPARAAIAKAEGR